MTAASRGDLLDRPGLAVPSGLDLLLDRRHERIGTGAVIDLGVHLPVQLARDEALPVVGVQGKDRLGEALEEGLALPGLFVLDLAAGLLIEREQPVLDALVVRFGLERQFDHARAEPLRVRHQVAEHERASRRTRLLLRAGLVRRRLFHRRLVLPSLALGRDDLIEPCLGDPDVLASFFPENGGDAAAHRQFLGGERQRPVEIQQFRLGDAGAEYDLPDALGEKILGDRLVQLAVLPDGRVGVRKIGLLHADDVVGRRGEELGQDLMGFLDGLGIDRIVRRVELDGPDRGDQRTHDFLRLVRQRFRLFRVQRHS